MEMTSTSRPRVFSGVQPSGNLHIGNYLGAIRNWVSKQYEKENIFCIVDLHAITVPQDPDELRRNVRNLAALYLAAGLDPKACALFVQSHRPEHSELAWILNCVTPLGWLERMTQYKAKAGEHRERESLGLLAYPTLMAADIILYNTDEVPVGDDQKQHVELTRDIVNRFNSIYGETFVAPKPDIKEVGARIMGLDDPTKKMSKSDPNPNHAIGLLESPAAVRKKIMRATTDSATEISFDRIGAGVANLLSIYKILTEKSDTEIQDEFSGKGYGVLKRAVADAVIEMLEPLQKRYADLTADPSTIDSILKDGAERIAPVAQDTLTRARTAMGL